MEVVSKTVLVTWVQDDRTFADVRFQYADSTGVDYIVWVETATLEGLAQEDQDTLFIALAQQQYDAQHG